MAIEMRKRGGKVVAVSDVAFDNSGYGLPNNIQFRAGRLEPGAVYDVSISCVMVNGVSHDYTYWFRIDPERKIP